MNSAFFTKAHSNMVVKMLYFSYLKLYITSVMTNYYDISIALAGVCQSAALVQSYAQRGSADQASFIASLRTLLVLQPDSTLNVYDNDLRHLKLGLETSLAQFGGGKGTIDTEIGRYWISLLALSAKLEKNPTAKTALAKRLQQIERQLQLLSLSDEQMISNLAAIYSDIISPLGSRIQVKGPQHILSRVDIQNRIRATLLAGIRSGILWQQMGGSRWQFLFARKKILQQTKALYQSL